MTRDAIVPPSRSTWPVPPESARHTAVSSHAPQRSFEASEGCRGGEVTCQTRTSHRKHRLPGTPDAPWWRFWEYFNKAHVADKAADLVFAGAANDLVVDTDSMTSLTDDPGLESFAGVLDFGTQSEVYHTNYFSQRRTLEFIRDALNAS